tara:strand:- start:991 stop:2187 length:1197 start_codon:yes stop_codon:yes gene_type:complete
MKTSFHKACILLVLNLFLNTNDLYCIEKIFSEHYKVQEGDDLEKIIRKKIWFKNISQEEKKKIISDMKRWNPQVTNWKKLELGSKLYLEFPRKWSREFPLITIPMKKLAIKSTDLNKNYLSQDKEKNKEQTEKNQRLPSSESIKKYSDTKIVYQKNPYNFDLSLGSKLFYFEEPVTNSGSKITQTNIVYDLDFKFDYPISEKFKFFFNLGGSYYLNDECKNSDEIEGYCNPVVTYKFPLSYSLKAGLKKALFSSTLKQGFSGLFTIEREGLSYISSNKAVLSTTVLERDGATLLKPNKSLFLWFTLGLDYNFSIWNKLSQLSASGSYCLSGESVLNTTGEGVNGGYWERLEPCFKINGEYKQYLGKNFWFSSYIKYISAKGMFTFTGIQNGLNLGYTF